MYNPQLETFLRVADAGSFNKAAEESYITPTAVIKQINLLEESLGVKLFERSHRGLTLTKAGRSMYQDAKYIIQYCRDSVTRAKNAMQEDENIIRIGSSPMTPAQLLMELWSRVQTLHPDIKFQIVPFENTPENAREILANLGKNIDVVGGIFDETMLHLRGCAGLELVRGPFHCAVSIHHRLAAKDKLQITDLYGENLMLMHRGWSHYVDQLRDDLWQHHPQIHIVDFDFYSMGCVQSLRKHQRCPAGHSRLGKCTPAFEGHSYGVGLQHSLRHSPFARADTECAALFGRSQNHQQRTVRLIITQRYILMNEARLLLKSCFFYNRGRSSGKGR